MHRGGIPSGSSCGIDLALTCASVGLIVTHKIIIHSNEFRLFRFDPVWPECVCV